MTPEQIIPRLLWLWDHLWVIWIVIAFWVIGGLFALIQHIDFPINPRR